MSAELLVVLALAVPLCGAIGIALVGRRYPNLREAVTLLTAISLLALVGWLWMQFMSGARPTVRLTEILPNIALEFRVEPLGMLFAALASLLWVVNSVYSIGYMRSNQEKNQTRFYACFAIALSATMGVAFAGNLLTLFIFYEILTLSTYPLVSHKGDPATVASARVYLGVLLVTSIGFFLPAIIWTYHVSGSLDFVPGGIIEGNLTGPAVGVLLALFAFGIGKAAIMPVHRWLPAAMVAPTPVSALLHAVAVVKAGVFTIMKVVIYIFGFDVLAAEASTSWLLYVAAFTVIAGSAIALRQTNLKRLLAYSTISQLSYVVMAVVVLQPLAGMGAAIHMVAHAFGKITLFFVAGAIYTATRKTELHQLEGIGKRMPWTMAAFTIGALSMIGLPLTGGFVSKWYMLSGALQATNYVVLLTIVVSTALNAAYFLPILYSAWFASGESSKMGGRQEAPLPIVFATMTSAVMALIFFLYNRPVLQLASDLFAY